MKKPIFTTLFLITIVLQSNAQDLLKEISRTFDNGQPMFIDYLETDNLKKVKTELYNEQGEIIFSMQFNPDSGLPDGEFHDLINKGSFSNGVLNCKNCMLVEANTPSVYTYNYNKQKTLITKGDVVNGRLVGEVKRYAISEDTYRQVDWESTRKYVAAGANVGFRDVKTYRTGNFKETLIDTKYYNENGVLDGIVYLDYTDGKYPNEVRVRGKLNVKNGIIKSLVSYDSKGLQRDSLSNEQEIWKIDYKFIKSEDFVIFESNFKSFVEIYRFSASDLILPIGGLQNYTAGRNSWMAINRDVKKSFRSSEFKKVDTGGPYTGLDINGLYSLRTADWTFFANEPLELLYMIYNSYKNNSILEQKLIGFVDGGETFFYSFIQQITKKNTDNKFYKFLKIKDPNEIYKNLPWRDDDDNVIGEYKGFNMPTGSYVYPNSINDYIISFSDYIKAAKEIVQSTEIQEVWVWNSVTEKYDKVDFDELMQLAEQKEEKAKAEAEEQARLKLEKEKKAKAEAEEQARLKLEKEKKVKAEAERKAKEEIQNTIKSLEPLYSSEKKSSGKYLKQMKESKEALIKSMNIDLVEIVIYRIPGVDDLNKSYAAYVFGSLKDLYLFKEEMTKSVNIQLFYDDLTKMTLYYTNKYGFKGFNTEYNY